VTGVADGNAIGHPATASALLPSNTAPIAASPGVIYANGQFTWTGTITPTFAPAILFTYTVQVTSSKPADAQVTATATISAPGATAGDAITLPIALQPFLLASMNVDKATVLPGDSLRYTIVLINLEAITRTVFVTDNIRDAGLLTHTTPITGSAFGGAVFAGDSLLWSASLPPHATARLGFSTRVHAEAPPGYVLRNAAAVEDDGNHLNISPTETSVDARASVPAPDLSSSLKRTYQVSVRPGDLITFFIDMVNTGPGNAGTVTVTDLLPSAELASLVGYSTPSGAVSIVGYELTWLGSLPAASRQTITITLRAQSSAPAGSLVRNMVVFIHDGINSPFVRYADSSIQATEQAAADLGLTAFAADRLFARAGENVTFTAILRNTGAPSAAYAVITPDSALVIWPGTVRTSAGTDGLTAAGNTITWQGALDSHTPVTITYQAWVSNSLPGNRLTTQLVANDANGGGPYLRAATVIVPGAAVFVPCVTR
jgi:hypothetical protein